MYYKSSLSYDIAVRNGERKLINLETLNIPCVAANNEELAGLVKKIINELYLDSTGCDKNHVPYYIETVVYDLLSGSYVGMQGISLRLLDKDAIKWAEKIEYRFDCIYSEKDITKDVLPMLKEDSSQINEENDIEKILMLFIQKPSPFKQENGFSVRVYEGKNKERVTCRGFMLPDNDRVLYAFSGKYIKDKKYGYQFEVESFDECVADTKDGIVAYLSSGVIKGIGSQKAEAIYEKFGDQTLEVIEKDPDKLLSIKGISKKNLKNKIILH
jgi:ATP-dependent exoDNAse (exonuclease V), alpha subunit - helicase superfamily I member